MQSLVINGRHFKRIDVLFDRYNEFSIKDETRNKRKKGNPIRRVIENQDVPLPHDWQGFLSDSENKSDLAKLLSHSLIAKAPDNKCVVTSGGLVEATDVFCNWSDLNVNELRSTHEEADTHILLHCKHTGSQSVVVWS